MNFPFYIARRYLFARKSVGAINVISALSVCGVALATMALVCTLSVFNGFQDLVATFFTAFDPELKVTPVRGKVFSATEPRIDSLRALPEVAVFSLSLEEHVMLRYQDRQVVATLKGVEDNFRFLCAIDSVLLGHGSFVLHDSVADYAVPGVGLVSALQTGIRFLDPLAVYAPRRGARVNPVAPASAFRSAPLHSSGLAFATDQQVYDDSYVLTSLSFVRHLFGYEGAEVTAVELRLRPNVDFSRAKIRIRQVVGPSFRVADRYEQQADTFRIMQVEKFLSYLFLTFILAVASFNVIGSLSMLILDKRADVATLRALGANHRLVERIFLTEGTLIICLGAFSGLAVGLLLCWLQQQFGFIPLGTGDTAGSFVVDAYPVSVRWTDVVLVFFTVLVVGALSVHLPVRRLAHRLLVEDSSSAF